MLKQMTNVSIDYSELIDEAMQTIVYHVLFMISKNGIIGDHHFYISFLTEISGTKISRYLKKKYPHEMTIVLQHQFEELKVYNDRMEITLKFNNIPEKLIIPFAAITSFVDPSVQFGLKFKKPYSILEKQNVHKEVIEHEDIIEDDEKIIHISQFLNKVK